MAEGPELGRRGRSIKSSDRQLRDFNGATVRLTGRGRSQRSGCVRWSPKIGQGFKVGSPLMKDGSDDWQTEALLG